MAKNQDYWPDQPGFRFCCFKYELSKIKGILKLRDINRKIKTGDHGRLIEFGNDDHDCPQTNFSGFFGSVIQI